jgi:hypothetical protein
MGLILRNVVNRPLSYAEVDANLVYLSSSFVGKDEASTLSVYSSVYAATASFNGGNAQSATYAQSASYASIALSASYVPIVSNITGGSIGRIPLWSSDTSLASSAIYELTDKIGIMKTVDLMDGLSIAQNLNVNGTTSLAGDTILGNSIIFDKGGDVARIYTQAKQLRLQSDVTHGSKIFLGTIGSNSDIETAEVEVSLGEHARTSGNIDVLKIGGALLQSTGSTTINFLNVNPTYEQRGVAFRGKVVGIYYNPTIITQPQGTHVAFENTKGDNYFNSTEGSTLIGTTDRENYKFKVSGTVKFDTLLNLAPVETLPERPTVGDIVMSGSLAEAVLCYYNGSTWRVL